MSKANNIRDGLSYLLEIASQKCKVMTCAEHDEFFAGLADEWLQTPEVVTQMKAFGWHVSDTGGFKIFT